MIYLVHFIIFKSNAIELVFFFLLMRLFICETSILSILGISGWFFCFHGLIRCSLFMIKPLRNWCYKHLCFSIYEKISLSDEFDIHFVDIKKVKVSEELLSSVRHLPPGP